MAVKGPVLGCTSGILARSWGNNRLRQASTAALSSMPVMCDMDLQHGQ